MYSKLVKEHKTREEISKVLLSRCNELGKMEFDEKFLKETIENQKKIK